MIRMNAAVVIRILRLIALRHSHWKMCSSRKMRGTCFLSFGKSLVFVRSALFISVNMIMLIVLEIQL